MATAKNFFDVVRPHFGGKLTQGQVDGMNAIIAGFAMYGDGDIQKLSYILATAKWETASTMQPIYERGQKTYFNKYEPGTTIGKNLGNTRPGDGYKFRGRGLVQITGRDNYARAGKIIGVDLVANPDKALEPAIAVRILIEGMLRGWFTAKGLTKYIDGIDESDADDLAEYVQARRTVNGQDKATLIANSAIIFERALRTMKAVKIEKRRSRPSPSRRSKATTSSSPRAARPHPSAATCACRRRRHRARQRRARCSSGSPSSRSAPPATSTSSDRRYRWDVSQTRSPRPRSSGG
jgi:putative chitinase